MDTMIAQPAWKPVAYNAILFTHVGGTIGEVGVNGLALRTCTGEVLFRTNATGLWQTLTDADAPNLQLLGDKGLYDAVAIEQNDLVRQCSRTLQAA